jgi:hypothetical protein
MGKILLAVGTTATIVQKSGSSPVTITTLKSIGGNTESMSMADVSGLADTTLVKAPARLDPGTVQFTCYLDDTVSGSNQFSTIRGYQTGKTAVTVAVTLPGSISDSFLSWTGYISETSTPELAAGDDALTYTFTLTQSSY